MYWERLTNRREQKQKTVRLRCSLEVSVQLTAELISRSRLTGDSKGT